MTRFAYRARLARLEGPKRNRDSLRRELRALEEKWLSTDYDALTEEQVEERLSAHAAEHGPFDRIDELRALLESPAERRARLARDAAACAAYMTT